MALMWFALVGLIAGWLAGQLVRGGGFGIAGDLAVGVLGALIGGALLRALGLRVEAGLLGSILVATAGAAVLIWILRLLKRA